MNPAPLIPDLSPDAANLSGWTVSTSGGVTELYYATAMQNLGNGAFELRAAVDAQGNPIVSTDSDGTQRQIVNQRVYNGNLSTFVPDGTFTDTLAGNFVYHPTHGHMHYDDFAWGFIRTRPTANWQDGTIVAQGPKTSFCLLDLNHNHPEFAGSPSGGVYNSCNNTKQGISRGWKDIYNSSLDGQQINITGLPNGDYWLEVTADPMNHVQETDETNNTTRIPITLTSQPSVGLQVLTASPQGANFGPLDHVDFTFNMAVQAGSFLTGDVVINGPSGAIAPTSVVQNSTTSFTVNIPSQGSVGTYTMTIGPNINSASDGKLMNQDNDSNYGEATADQYIAITTITAPRILSATPTGSISSPVSSIRLTYNKPVNTGTVSQADVFSFTGPGNVDLMSQITGVVAVTQGTSTLFDVNFNSQSVNGTYTLVMEPNVADPLGNTVDQNGDGVTNAVDRYTTTFTKIPAGVVGPDAFGYSAYGAVYESFSGVTGWTQLIGNGDDLNTQVNFGTDTFNLYGTTYTGNAALFVNSNGLITFGVGTSAYSNSSLSSITYNSNTIYPPALAPLWDDFITGAGTPMVRGKFQDINGDSKYDRYIIEWNKVNHYDFNNTGADLTFQAVLQLNTGATPGDITFNYADLTTGSASYDNGASATVGIRANGSAGTKLLVAQNSSSNSLVNSLKAIRVGVPKVASITRIETPTIEAGEAEFLVTFTEGVTGVDTTDFTFVPGGGVTGASIHEIHPTSDPAIYEVHCNTGVGSGTFRINLVDNDSIVSLANAKLGGVGAGNGNFTAGQTYTVEQPAPQVLGINVDDGTNQRSQIHQLQVVFDWKVEFAGGDANAANAFTLVGPNGPVTLAVDLSASAPTQTVARLTFSGNGTELGSLMDGNYTLTVLASKISTGGEYLDGDGDGEGNDDYSTDAVFRLFGDRNGDGNVGPNDYSFFGASFGLDDTDPGFDAAFDFNGDHVIDSGDLGFFGMRFGMSL